MINKTAGYRHFNKQSTDIFNKQDIFFLAGIVTNKTTSLRRLLKRSKAASSKEKQAKDNILKRDTRQQAKDNILKRETRQQAKDILKRESKKNKLKTTSYKEKEKFEESPCHIIYKTKHLFKIGSSKFRKIFLFISS